MSVVFDSWMPANHTTVPAATKMTTNSQSGSEDTKFSHQIFTLPSTTENAQFDYIDTLSTLRFDRDANCECARFDPGFEGAGFPEPVTVKSISSGRDKRATNFLPVR